MREREGAGSFVAMPHGHFRTIDDKWVSIACTSDKMFEHFAAVMASLNWPPPTATARANWLPAETGDDRLQVGGQRLQAMRS